MALSFRRYSWQKDFEVTIQPWINDSGNESGETVTVAGLFEEFARTAPGYRDVWRRLTALLVEKREAMVAEVTGNSTAELDEIIAYMRRSIRDSNRNVPRMGVTMVSPLDRAFRRVCSLRTGIPEKILEDEQVNAFIQQLYDQTGSAAQTIRSVKQALEEADESEENQFLIDQLLKMNPTQSARKLTKRGIDLRPKAEVIAKTQFQRGDSERGVRSRCARLRRLSRLSSMRREEERIRLSDLREFPYAGRRLDIRDYTGHHPFITSIYSANLARLLDRQSRRWEYRPRFFHIEVPEDEDIPQRNIGFEPDFYLPDEDLYIVVLTDRRHSGNPLGSLGERTHWLDFVRQARPDLNIESVISSELSHGDETEYRSIREDHQTFREPGYNIQTNPDQFLLGVDECPCRNCQGQRPLPM